MLSKPLWKTHRRSTRARWRMVFVAMMIALGLWADSLALAPSQAGAPTQRFVPTEHIHADKIVDFPVDI